MSGPRDEEDLVPLTLQRVVDRPQGWRNRSGSVVAFGLVGFIVVGLVLGSALGGGPRQPDEAAVAPSSAAAGTPRPTNRPTPTRTPRPTPLPSLEILGGRIPTEERLVQGNGFELLDLATGTLRPVATGADGPYVPVPGGGFVCACAVLDPTLAPGAMTVRFRRIDPDGTTVVNRRILRYDEAEAVPNMTDGWAYTAALSADGRELYVVSALRDTATWTVRLLVVDTASGKLVANDKLLTTPLSPAQPQPSGTAPPNSSSDGNFIWLSTLAVSRDGRTVYVTVNSAEVRADVWINRTLEWMVPIEAGVPGTPLPLADADVVRDVQWCLTSGVFAGNVVGQVCSQADGSTEPLVVRRVTTEGQVLQPVPLPASSFDGRTILVSTVDRERGALLVWDAGKHVLARVDLLRGDVESVEVPDSMLPTEGRAREPSRGYLGVYPGVVLSPDGARIYALGIGRGRSEMGVSSGVWVFDGDTLEALDRFEPRAMLTSLAVSADGTFVYASSPAGFDVAGNENPDWPASVTVYDARNGEIQVLYGAVDSTSWLSFVEP
jgi:hypothetical protein